MPRAALSVRRLLGFDRSGPPPPETAPDAPLRPWTIPNAIGYARAALIPVILIFAYGSGDGTAAGTGICFFLAGAGDYADGITARVTGQYSRMGAMLDPVLDRLLALSGLAICWSFELLPRWLIGVVVAREALMLVLGQAWLRRGLALAINWPGRDRGRADAVRHLAGAARRARGRRGVPLCRHRACADRNRVLPA